MNQTHLEDKVFWNNFTPSVKPAILFDPYGIGSRLNSSLDVIFPSHVWQLLWEFQEHCRVRLSSLKDMPGIPPQGDLPTRYHDHLGWLLLSQRNRLQSCPTESLVIFFHLCMHFMLVENTMALVLCDEDWVLGLLVFSCTAFCCNHVGGPILFWNTIMLTTCIATSYYSNSFWSANPHQLVWSLVNLVTPFIVVGGYISESPSNQNLFHVCDIVHIYILYMFNTIHKLEVWIFAGLMVQLQSQLSTIGTQN